MVSYRLNKVAKDLNVGIKTLATAFQSERKVKEMSLQEKKPKPRPKRVFAEPKEEKAWHPTPRYQGLDSQNTRKEYGSSAKPVRIGRN